MIKYAVILTVALLSGCTTTGIFEHSPRTVEQKVVVAKPKVIVKTKIVKQLIPVPQPSRPITPPKKIDVTDSDFVCPLISSYPNADTLTNAQIKSTIEELRLNNKICHYNIEALRVKINNYNKYLDMGEKFDG